MTAAHPTAGQTVGPFFGTALPYPGGAELVPASHENAVLLRGRVLDGAGEPVPDALVELWQGDGAGAVVRASGSLRRDGLTFTGWGRAATGADGGYAFRTVRPGGTNPYFAVVVFARGLLDRLFTRAYLPGSPGPAADPDLGALPRERLATLLASTDSDGYRFDIRLQGPDETVFVMYR